MLANASCSFREDNQHTKVISDEPQACSYFLFFDPGTDRFGLRQRRPHRDASAPYKHAGSPYAHICTNGYPDARAHLYSHTGSYPDPDAGTHAHGRPHATPGHVPPGHSC